MPSDWTLDLFQAEDAPGVVALYRAIYGDSYHVSSVYDPAQLISQQECGEVYRAVARDARGEVVGHTAYARSSPPNQNLYEACQLLVNHTWRGTTLGTDLTLFAIEQIPVRYNLQETWGEAVCNHNFSQRIYTQSGYAETGMELDLLPGESMARSMRAENRGRISVVTIFRGFDERPQTIYLPPVYKEQLPFLYAGFHHGNTFATAKALLPAAVVTSGKADIFASVSVARITFFELGVDFEASLAAYDKQAADAGIQVYQVFLPLTTPAVGEAVAILRRHAYFLGAVLPRWYGDDGLLMQKLTGPPNFGGIHLFTGRSREILSLLQADMLTVN